MSNTQGNLTKCPPPNCFKFTGVKGDGKECVLSQKLAAEVDNSYSVQNLTQITFFEIGPKNIIFYAYGKSNSRVPIGRKFQGLCDILNRWGAIDILSNLFNIVVKLGLVFPRLHDP